MAEKIPDYERYNRQPESKYRLLHERGVILDDESIDWIIDTAITEGIEPTKRFLGVRDDSLKIVSLDQRSRIGYNPEISAINIPIKFFNDLAAYDTPLNELPITLSGVTGLSKSLTLDLYLIAAAIEETVHHFQTVGGSKKLSGAKPSEGKAYDQISELGRCLCDFEVEARKITDEILMWSGYEPVWEKFDEQLAANYPNRYNQPIDVQLNSESTQPQK